MGGRLMGGGSKAAALSTERRLSSAQKHQCSKAAALYIPRYMMHVYNQMRVRSPDACGTTRRHQRIQACAESHGSNDHVGSERCNIAKTPNQLCAQSAQQHRSEGA